MGTKKKLQSDLMCAKFLRKIIVEQVTYVLVQNAIDEGIVQDFVELLSKLDRARRSGDEEAEGEYKAELDEHSFTDIMHLLESDDNFSYDYESYTPNMDNFKQYVQTFTETKGKKTLRVPSFNGDTEDLLRFYIRNIVNIPE